MGQALEIPMEAAQILQHFLASETVAQVHFETQASVLVQLTVEIG
jgi:hypothetical protein